MIIWYMQRNTMNKPFNALSVRLMQYTDMDTSGQANNAIYALCAADNLPSVAGESTCRKGRAAAYAVALCMCTDRKTIP
jgi:hypothetical protein